VTLKYTLDQVRDRQVAAIGVKGIPNGWWPLAAGNDCLAFQLERLGVRSKTDLEPHFISISAFRAWAGWDEVAVADMQPGDLACWNFSGGTLPEHIEYTYSIDHAGKTVTTISANTGPTPGVPVPRGVWKKTRPITGALLFGIRPPVLEQAAATSKGRKDVVRFIAAYLNDRPELNTLPNTAAEHDGVEGPVYWRLVQTWGRKHGQYGPTFHIDGVPGPRTRQVEAAAFKAAKAAG
jgi:hypothetical protein